MLPTTKITAVLGDDGQPLFKESTDRHIVYPADPSGMQWHHVKAYFDLLKDPNSKFAWRVEESSADGNLADPPASVQESLQQPQRTNPAAERSKGRRKSKSSEAVVASDLSRTQQAVSARGGQPHPPSQSTNAGDKPKRRQRPESEEEAVFSDESTDSSDYSVGSESSADESYRASTQYILRPETYSRVGRRSAPPTALAGEQASQIHSNISGGDDSDELRTEPKDTARPAPFARRAQVTAAKTSSLLISPEKTFSKQPPHEPINTKLPYVLKPSTEPLSAQIPVRCLRLHS